jgi:hypothetical protein
MEEYEYLEIWLVKKSTLGLVALILGNAAK